MHVLLALVLWVAPAQDAEIDRLIQALGSDEPRERERAERRLIELGGRARPAVVRASKEGNAETAARAREVLRSIGFRMVELYEAGFRVETARAIPEFGLRFWSSVPAERASAVRDLANHGSPGNIAAVAKVLEREDLHDDVRMACADLMEKLGTPTLAKTVIPILRSQTFYHRPRILQILVATGSKEAAPAMLPLLLERELSHVAADSLEKLGVPLPEESIRKMLLSPEEGVRAVAMNAIVKHRLKGFTADLIALLQRGGSDNSWSLQDALSRSQPAWTDLKPLLHASTGTARRIGLRAAVTARMAEAFDAALELLDDDDAETRREAMNVAVAWGGPEAARRLAAKEGPGATIALAWVGAPEAKARALKALESPAPSLRQAGITALRALDAHDAAEAILPRLDDPDPDVRAEAARVLPHLAGDAAGARVAARLSKEENPKVLVRLLDAVVETAHREAAPQVLRLLKEGNNEVVPAAVRAAGTLRLQQAVPLMVEGYVTLKPEGMGGAYEALLQIRPDNLVELLRPHVAPKKKNAEDDDGGAIIKRISMDENRTYDRALYLLYLDPPGAKELLLQCLKDGIAPNHPVETIRFLCAEEAIPWLVKELEGGERGGMRMSGAGRFLASYGRRELLEKAVIWLSKGNREAAFELFSGLPAEDKVPEIAALLDGPDQHARDAALTALLRIGGSRVTEIVRKRWAKSSPLERAVQARYLMYLDAGGLVAEMETLLDHEDPAVRVEAAYTLYQMDSPVSYDRLVQAYRRGIGKDDWVWSYALAKSGGAKGRALVRSEFEASPELDKRKPLLRAMASGQDFAPDEIAFVARYLDDPDLCSDAWSSYVRMDPVRATGLLSDSRYRLGMGQGNSTLSDLEHLRTPGAVTAMISRLTDREPSTRVYAAIALRRMDAREALEPLAKAVHDEDRSTRSYAAVALARLGDRRGVDEILKMTRHTTVAQGRMNEALLALNFARNPELSRTLAAVRWQREGPGAFTFKEALEQLAERSGMKLTLSKAVEARGLRAPLDWPRTHFGLEEIACGYPWSRFAALVIEPGEIRVLTPDEAYRFWEGWARAR